MLAINQIHQLNCYEGLKQLPANSIRCCVTSPPYYGLRDYGLPNTAWPAVEYQLFGFTVQVPAMECCLGLESTPEAFIGHLILIFNEINRVLTADGTCWVNLGDSYAASSMIPHTGEARVGRNNKYMSGLRRKPTHGLKQKDLVGIPWMFAFAMRSAGWYLRQDIIWHKPNPMPESVTDRCTKAHEYIFLFSKRLKYYFNQAAIKQPYADKTLTTFGSKMAGAGDGTGLIMAENRSKSMAVHKPKQWPGSDESGANKRSVWTVATYPLKEAHFATFPTELITDCIQAGSAEGDTVLDPFSGAATTAVVAAKLSRNFIGFELNPDYIKIGARRLHQELGIFNIHN